ncbi:hypothetical protein VTK73DRAFT_3366 [Phialemonium thermophilum]|uniref:LysM domain-containing protein n=1 Tax=Phialemonium thermophilum TaxID=223376 RepID=A0ABR3WZF6_9PEZI
MTAHRLLLAASVLRLAVATVVPFPDFVGKNGFGSDSSVSQSCAAALNSTIDCDASLRILAIADDYISPNLTGIAPSLCAPGCNSSLAAYQSNVQEKCGSSPVIDPQVKNTFMGDLLQDYYDLICTKDPGSDQYCVDFLNSSYAELGTVASWSDLPEEIACSACQISFWQVLQRSPFLGYNADAALSYLNIQKICGLSLPLAVDPNSNLTFSDPPNQITVDSGCSSGSKYTVKAGDTCKSIAVSNSVGEGTLWAINNIQPNCSAMTIGQSLCLPKQCTLYTLKPGDTCQSITAATGVSFSSLLGYNPTISPDCGNLNMTGSVVCISNPEGDFDPPPSPSNPNVKNQYATAEVPAPGPTPFRTTPHCGTFYQVQVADTCQRITLAAGVSLDLFEEINPSIDADCHNLIPGLWYCVQPTKDWNTTAPSNPTTSTTLAPPAPTPPGTTGNCFAWHVVVSGDTCQLLEETLGVTMDQLILWNPNLAADCSNLLLGEAYCVAGPTGTATATGTATSTAATSTATSTSSSVCTLGEGPGNFAGLCSFSCNFGFCPPPCNCTKHGDQIPPPPGDDTVGYPAAGLEDENYYALCSFTCSHGYCPDGACTSDQSKSNVPSTDACIAGESTNPNQLGLCSFSCNYGYCPPPVCICTAYGPPVPAPNITNTVGVPLPGEDGSYIGLCSFDCNHGYCPDTACTTA